MMNSSLGDIFVVLAGTCENKTNKNITNNPCKLTVDLTLISSLQISSMLSADREEPDLVTLAGKEEEVEKSEDRTESSGSSIESGDLGSGVSDISKLITIN